MNCRRPLRMTKSLDIPQANKVVVVIGEGESGKTCLTKCLVKQDIEDNLKAHLPTIDESHYTMKKMPDGTNQLVQFIDTSPWQEFPVMHRLYVKTAQLVLIVYNVASKNWKESLIRLISQTREIKENVDIMVVGTHSDLMNSVMHITPAHVRDVIGDLRHVYVSSATNFGMTHLWNTILTAATALTKGHLSDERISNRTRVRRRSTVNSLERLARKTSVFLCTGSRASV
ncbi:GTP-binding protein Di-Ras1-like [Watersipora subatra]|uniref:GTP-binding protein Di-Ras1-like n=1 Tax=Watersipora subatra TaxID=2589382 RepID=UPI00355BB624